MKIDEYLERIGHDGAGAPDLATLRSVHRHHAQSIPYENVDVQLGRRLDLDPVRTFHKLVTRGRGGWCFEMNGLLEWALIEIGFDVTRMVGGVPGVEDESIDPMGGHLVLSVDLGDEGLWLADVGLAGAMLEPIPFRAGEHEAGGRTFRLLELGDGRWRFENHEGVRPPSFDFVTEPDEELFLTVCERLQDNEESIFRQNLLCVRFESEETVNLLGRVLIRPGGERHLIADAEELVEVLGREFGIDDPELGLLWPAVEARHRELFGA